MLLDPAVPELSQAQLQAVLHGVADAVVVTDPQGRVRSMNAAAGAFYGYEHLLPHVCDARGLRQRMRETFVLTREDGEPLEDDAWPWDRAFAGEAFDDVILRVRRRDEAGSRVFAFRCAKVDGEPPLTVLTLRDVTERHRLGLRYRASFESNPTPVFIARLVDGIVVDANASLCQLTDRSREGTIGLPLTVLGFRPGRGELRDALGRLQAGGGVEELPATIAGPGRKTRSVVLSARPIEIDDAPCAIFTCLDITKEREAQDALKALAEFGEAMESMHDFDELVRRGLAILVSQLDVDFGAFHEISPTGASHRTVVGDVPEELRAYLRRPLPRGQGTMGHVARTGRPHIVPDHRTYVHGVPAARALGVVSSVTLPVKLGGETRFVLALATLHRRVHMDEATIETAMAYVRRLENALERAQYLREIEATREATFRSLGLALEHRDLKTRGHMDRVVELSQRFAGEVGLDEEETQALTWGAYLHDLGKIGLPDTVLFKPGVLTDDEADRKNLHTLNGVAMIRDIPFLPTETRQVVRSHHERWDGGGYPDALAGNEIPLLARMFSFVDVFDALTSERPYKSAWSTARARQEIERSAGTQFDPSLVKPFLRALDGWLASKADA
jgi:response regulator RpfG family c-di-GMP phosphodiesterase/PAS domain-containing protein